MAPISAEQEGMGNQQTSGEENVRRSTRIEERKSATRYFRDPKDGLEIQVPCMKTQNNSDEKQAECGGLNRGSSNFASRSATAPSGRKPKTKALSDILSRDPPTSSVIKKLSKSSTSLASASKVRNSGGQVRRPSKGPSSGRPIPSWKEFGTAVRCPQPAHQQLGKQVGKMSSNVSTKLSERIEAREIHQLSSDRSPAARNKSILGDGTGRNSNDASSGAASMEAECSVATSDPTEMSDDLVGDPSHSKKQDERALKHHYLSAASETSDNLDIRMGLAEKCVDLPTANTDLTFQSRSRKRKQEQQLALEHHSQELASTAPHQYSENLSALLLSLITNSQNSQRSTSQHMFSPHQPLPSSQNVPTSSTTKVAVALAPAPVVEWTVPHINVTELSSCDSELEVCDNVREVKKPATSMMETSVVSDQPENSVASALHEGAGNLAFGSSFSNAGREQMLTLRTDAGGDSMDVGGATNVLTLLTEKLTAASDASLQDLQRSQEVQHSFPENTCTDQASSSNAKLRLSLLRSLIRSNRISIHAALEDSKQWEANFNKEPPKKKMKRKKHRPKIAQDDGQGKKSKGKWKNGFTASKWKAASACVAETFVTQKRGPEENEGMKLHLHDFQGRGDWCQCILAKNMETEQRVCGTESIVSSCPSKLYSKDNTSYPASRFMYPEQVPQENLALQAAPSDESMAYISSLGHSADGPNTFYYNSSKLASQLNAYRQLASFLNFFQQSYLIHPCQCKCQFHLGTHHCCSSNHCSQPLHLEEAKESLTSSAVLIPQRLQPMHHERLQMVLYNQNRDIVPSKAKKRPKKPRAMVQLDAESKRVWLLLEDGGTLPEEDDYERARAWEEKRTAMRGHIEKFIACMRMVQGNRRFSQWKGSIVDSVVGAFLTQNVSDHLSSSAFMSIASRFPADSKTEISDFCEHGKSFGVQFSSEDQSTPAERVSTDLGGTCVTNKDTKTQDPVICDESSSSNEFIDDLRVDSQLESGSLPLESCTFGQTEVHTDRVRRRLDFDKCLDKGHQTLLNDRESALHKTNQQGGHPHDNIDSLEMGHTFLNAEQSKPHKIDQQDVNSNDNRDGLETEDIALQKIEQQGGNSHDNRDGLEVGKILLDAKRSALHIIDQQDGNLSDNRDGLEWNLSLYEPDNNNVIQGCMESDFKLLKDVENVSTLSVTSEINKRSHSLSSISGIERAQIEASQSGHKQGKRDWEFLRRQVLGISTDNIGNSTQGHKGNPVEQDAVNWEAVRLADLQDLAETIKERGMHHILSGRIKAFLSRLYVEHGSLDLEWMRKLSFEDARDYLMSIRGLGVKSVECIRLLALHHVAFPVDTNVARICVRLGWVPIEPLPEELQLHLLEMYPVQEQIQKYLWPRLCTLDQHTLYELHYQLITFGKVFCTKRKPNCSACPMRGECKHFGSAYASSRLLLSSTDKIGEVKGELPALLAADTTAMTTAELKLPLFSQQAIAGGELVLTSNESTSILEASSCQGRICEPIIEEPLSPEHAYRAEIKDIEDFPSIHHNSLNSSDIEDFCSRYNISPDCPETYRKNKVSFTGLNGDKISLENSVNLHGHLPQHQNTLPEPTLERTCCQFEGTLLESKLENLNAESEIHFPSEKSILQSSPTSEVTSNAIVPLPLEFATIPVPKLKNVGRLRTVHNVYELPDSHPLLHKMDTRVNDDPCYYLLAIWGPVKVPQCLEEMDVQSKGDSYIKCDTIDGHGGIVKGTLLIPCRTAMRGSFPLNGTYFQVNEVFADHATSLNPLEVPRSLIWNLQRRLVFFGTSIPSIFRGLSTEEITKCFWMGHVCVRGFDRHTHAPKPLLARFHFPISKQTKPSKRATKDSSTSSNDP